MASGEGEGGEEEEEEEEEESDSDGDKKLPSRREVVKVRVLIRSQTTLLYKQCLELTEAVVSFQTLSFTGAHRTTEEASF